MNILLLILAGVVGVAVLLAALVASLAAAGQAGVQRAKRKYGFTDAEADRWSRRVVELGEVYSTYRLTPETLGLDKQQHKEQIKQGAAEDILRERGGSALADSPLGIDGEAGVRSSLENPEQLWPGRPSTMSELLASGELRIDLEKLDRNLPRITQAGLDTAEQIIGMIPDREAQRESFALIQRERTRRSP